MDTARGPKSKEEVVYSSRFVFKLDTSRQDCEVVKQFINKRDIYEGKIIKEIFSRYKGNGDKNTNL